jgi:hypothetical protein
VWGKMYHRVVVNLLFIMTILDTVNIHNCVCDTSEQTATGFVPINVCSNRKSTDFYV